MKDDLIVGKQCVYQIARFLVDNLLKQIAISRSRVEITTTTKKFKWKLSLIPGNPVVEMSVSRSVTQTAACTTKQELTKPPLLFFWDRA